MPPLFSRGIFRLSVVAWLTLCLPASAQSVTGGPDATRIAGQTSGRLQVGSESGAAMSFA